VARKAHNELMIPVREKEKKKQQQLKAKKEGKTVYILSDSNLKSPK
jgi:hypothetical protein